MDSTYSTSSSDYSYNTSVTDIGAAGAAVSGVVMLVMLPIYLAIIAVAVVSMWKLFVKANKPGWASLVPIYNLVVMLEIVGRPMWWIVMFFLPVANVIFMVMLYIDLAKSYGKDAGWGILMVFFPIIVMPILAFDKKVQYVGPVGPEGQPYTPPVAPTMPQTPMQ